MATSTSAFPQRKRLGQHLIDLGVITQAQLDEAITAQRATGEKLGAVLQRLGFVTEAQLFSALKLQMGIPYVDLHSVVIPPEVVAMVPAPIARRHNIVPVRLERDTLYIAMEDPFDFVALDDVRLTTGHNTQPLLASKEALSATVSRLYASELAQQVLDDIRRDAPLDALQNGTAASSDTVSNAPIVRLVNSLLQQAVQRRASDVHIEPFAQELRVRMRIDGQLTTIMSIPQQLHGAVITRLKIMANLDIAEHRLPQDGRCEITVEARTIDLRVSVLPSVFGEKCVLRILDRASFLVSRDQLGMPKASLEAFDQLLKNPHGIILVSGPTGSGKTTTLYTMLAELNDERCSIVTVEDPVEYMMHGITQVQVNPKADLTFAGGLRSILRQDPDIIMVGEIRDAETTQIALRAAITGHLVLSTIHTNDALSTISRLINMGAEPYMLAAALSGMISQRLVRKVCPHCAQRYTPSAYELEMARMQGYRGEFMRARGCAFCNNTGYMGRTGVFEICNISHALRELIAGNRSADQLHAQALKDGLIPLAAQCQQLLEDQVTTLSEVVRLIYAADNA
nr:GspE/PulE family protein [Maliibacterium massiliense]